jgi:hypothetical protein
LLTSPLALTHRSTPRRQPRSGYSGGESGSWPELIARGTAASASIGQRRSDGYDIERPPSIHAHA